jgi:hypothetical protein
MLLGGCTPRPPGFVVVGRDSHGVLIGGMVVCADAPDTALLTPTDQIEKTSPKTQAQWQLRREDLQQGHLITWPLFGSTTDETIRSLDALTKAPVDAMSLYVQREPSAGASGIDFSMAQLNALSNSQFLFRDSADDIQAGTEADVEAAVYC